jgi:alanine dehydrogenase
MNILLLKENKNENRVALLPDDVREIIRNKNTIFVQKNYGIKNFISDEEYKNASATIFDNLNNIAKDIDVVVKIGELSKKEAKLLQGKILISNLNLSNNPKNLNLILRNNITSIALEEIDTDNHNYNFYQCNEQLKGRFAALVSSYYLGKVIPFAIGKTFSPIPYCKTHAHYTIMNCGEAGIAAAKVILSFGGKVTFLEEDEEV